ncbi:unnamed protein product [Closterium sp. NIES-65]|nr:unnamed protein product [Closterium sp. NIES-65]
MADLQALRDELLGQLCRRCAGCDKHDANGEGGGTQDGGSKPVKEPVRVKSPEEIARDFINAETGGWQYKPPSNVYILAHHLASMAEILQQADDVFLLDKQLRKKVLVALGIKRRNDHDGVEDPKELDDAELLIGYGNEPLQGTAAPNLLLSPHLRLAPSFTLCLAEPLQGTAAPNLLLSPHLRYPPALLSAWQSNCKARQCLTCSFPPISVIPLPYSLPGKATAGQPLQGTEDSNLLLFPHLRLAPALLSALQSHCKARQHLTCSFPPSPLSPCLSLCLAVPLQGVEEPLQGMGAPNLILSPHLRYPPAVLSAWQSLCKARKILTCSFPHISSHCRAYKLEYPILEKTADGKLSSKPDYNRPLYEEKVKWCWKWVEHAVTNLGVGYDEDRDVFVFGNGILVDASDYAAGFKKTTIVLK